MSIADPKSGKQKLKDRFGIEPDLPDEFLVDLGLFIYVMSKIEQSLEMLTRSLIGDQKIGLFDLLKLDFRKRAALCADLAQCRMNKADLANFKTLIRDAHRLYDQRNTILHGMFVFNLHGAVAELKRKNLYGSKEVNHIRESKLTPEASIRKHGGDRKTINHDEISDLICVAHDVQSKLLLLHFHYMDSR